MTAMQQIEALCVEARRHGMTYGQYINKFAQSKQPEKIQDEFIPEEKEKKICKRCGEEFTPENNRVKYCALCKYERMAEYQKAYRDKKRAAASVDKNGNK